jgi:hypothetical protein
VILTRKSVAGFHPQNDSNPQRDGEQIGDAT